MDKIYEICFSPTGGTERVAAILAKALASETVSVDLTVRDVDFGSVTLGKDDVAMIAVPSYSGRVPAVAAARLAEMHGNGARAILVCVYGNRAYEDTLVELRDTASRAGFTVIAAVAAVAEHSIARQYAAGRPDADDEAVLRNFAERIRSKIDNGDTGEPEIPGNRPYRKAAGEVSCPRLRVHASSAAFVRRNVPSAPSMRRIRVVSTRSCVSPACGALRYVHTERGTLIG